VTRAVPRSAISVGASDGFPRAVFAGYLVRQGRYAEAIEQYRAALELGTDLGDDCDRAVEARVTDLERILEGGSTSTLG
jgi:hypothetical protein